MSFNFVEETTLLKRVYQGCYLWSHRIDAYYAMKYNELYNQFHEQTLNRYGKCQRCHNNKKKRSSYCYTCAHIEYGDDDHEDGCYCAGHFIEAVVYIVGMLGWGKIQIVLVIVNMKNTWMSKG